MSQNRGGSTEPNMSDLEMPEPPQDWPFNHLLHDIGESISQEELEKIKHLFQGQEGFGRRILAEITTPQRLFSVLRGSCFLSRDNLIYLQQALRTLGRKDLLQKAIEYARQAGNVIHFYPASQQPENGYTFIKVHVGGKDYSTYSRDELDKLRNRLCRILMAPPEAVLFAGIEPASSLVITIMIPEEYANLMRGMLQEGQEFPELTEIDADIVKIGDSLFHLQGKHTQTTETEQHSKLATVYQQLQVTSRQLENSQHECIELTDKLQGAVRKLRHQEHVGMTLKAILKQKPGADKEKDDKHISEGEKAFEDFCQSLNETSEKGYDQTVIKRLLDSNTAIVAIGVTANFRFMLLQLNAEVSALKALHFPLKLELFKYKRFSSGNTNQLIVEWFQLLTSIVGVPQQHTVSLTPDAAKVLRTISSSLSAKDRQTLMADYTWDKDDNLTNTMKRNKDMFLAAVLLKEIQKRNQLDDFVQFISSCLERVGREDLKETFLQKVAKMPTNETPESGTHKTGAGRVSPDQTVNEDVIQQDMELKDTISKMASQVDIYSTMQSTMSAYDDSFSPLKQPHFCDTNFDGADFNSRQSFPAN